MIYIFDDRAQRRKDNEDKLRAFAHVVKFGKIDLKQEQSLKDWFLESVSDCYPECIIFHKSYVSGDDRVTFENVRQLFTSLKIPFVIFSGGTEGSNKGQTESNINADLMYENLPYFLSDFNTNKKINIDILLWGKRYKLNAILQFQNEISKQFLINKDLDAVVEDIDDVRTYIEDECHNCQLSNAIIKGIQENEEITWSDLDNIIDKNIKVFM